MYLLKTEEQILFGICIRWKFHYSLFPGLQQIQLNLRFFSSLQGHVNVHVHRLHLQDGLPALPVDEAGPQQAAHSLADEGGQHLQGGKVYEGF